MAVALPVLRPALLATFALALILCGCETFSMERHHKQQNQENRFEIDEYNCRWQLTHFTDANGEVTEVQVDENTLDAKVRECMVARGHYGEQKDEEEASGEEKNDDSGWWPF